MVTILMSVDAVVAILLIASIVLQSGKSAGLGAVDGGAEAIFGDKIKGLDELLSKATIFLGAIFAILNIALAKLTMV